MLKAGTSSVATLARGFAARVNAPGATAVLRSFAAGGTGDMHDDFKPQYKEQPTGSVEATIKGDISSNRVMLYMKGDPEAPMCGFSNMVVQILNHYGVEYGSRNVLADPDLREGIKKFSNWPTIPQVYVNGEFVGGSDILMGLHQSGDLKAVLGSGPDQDAPSSA